MTIEQTTNDEQHDPNVWVSEVFTENPELLVLYGLEENNNEACMHKV